MTDQTAARTPVFCDTALAAGIERAEAELIAAWNDAARRRAGRRGVTGFAIPVAGGLASYAERDSPLNKVVGIGFAGPPMPSELDAVERAFADHGVPVPAEVASLADPAVFALLAERGYRLASFENVLGRAPGGAVDPVSPPGVQVRRSGAEEFDAWLGVVVEASLNPDTQGVPFPRSSRGRSSRTPNATRPASSSGTWRGWTAYRPVGAACASPPASPSSPRGLIRLGRGRRGGFR
jgi:hypothetical protein